MKKNIKEKSERKPAVNRRVLVWLFVLTGVVSLFFWWRGRMLKSGGEETPRVDWSFVIERKTNPTAGQAGSESQRQNEAEIEEFLKGLEEIIATASGRYAVYVYHPEGDWGYGINETEEKPGASILKVPVMLAAVKMVERGEVKFSDEYVLEDADRTAGSGPLQFKPAGTSYSLDTLLTYLGKNSDNTAWVMLNRRWGRTTIQETMDRVGMRGSSYINLITTAADVARMWKYVYNGEMSSVSRQALYRYLSESIYEDRIPAGLAKTEAEVIAHKVGTDADVWADAGIIRCSKLSTQCSAKPFVLVILNEGIKRQEAEGIVPEIVKRVWDFENMKI